MPIETEKKFLVDPSRFCPKGSDVPDIVHQYYLTTSDPIVRVRRVIAHNASPKYSLTLKSSTSDPTSRLEDEFSIAAEDFAWDSTEYRLQKLRYRMRDGWVVDVFVGGPLHGVAVAEYEASPGQIVDWARLPYPGYLFYPDGFGNLVDLTALPVQLVAAGALSGPVAVLVATAVRTVSQ